MQNSSLSCSFNSSILSLSSSNAISNLSTLYSLIRLKANGITNLDNFWLCFKTKEPNFCKPFGFWSSATALLIPSISVEVNSSCSTLSFLSYTFCFLCSITFLGSIIILFLLY